MATRIVDLDRGKLVSWPGNYDLYLQSKEEALRVEELQNAEFDRKAGAGRGLDPSGHQSAPYP